jgi:hypothetical protein
MTSKAPPHHHTTSMLHGGNHTCGDHPFTYSVSQRHSGWKQKSTIWTHQTKGQISTGLMSIAHTSWPKQVFFLLVSFSSSFDHEGLIPTVYSEQLMLRCVCYLNSEAFIKSAISEAGNSTELILCSRGNWVFLSCGGPHES